MRDWKGLSLYTVGHSTRTLEELVALLRSFEVESLADIRTVPKSRRHPWFWSEALTESLPALGVRYLHLPTLGGLRHARKDSPNGGWRNASFRGYADYMLTESFEQGLVQLHELVAEARAAIMCAEAVPWRCHRSLVADVLTVRGAHVEHIMAPGRSNPHRLTSFARVHGAQVLYPGA